MTLTIQKLKELKQTGYDVYPFTDLQSSSSTTFFSLFTNNEIPITNLARFSSDKPRVVSVVSNECEQLLSDSASSLIFDVHNDGLLYLCLKELNQSCF